ncbi:MAG TPA: Rne/Rng family ribonuclease [Stellaceae bacterium]|nr:Rne/Rng family ribonuclease [Stellaceae bacterium]
MAKRMLIDATHPEETRVVVLSGNRLDEFDFESSTKKQVKGNIYLAKVTRVEPSLQAAFVDYGGNRHGFLPFSEIHSDYYRIPVSDRAPPDRNGGETETSEPAAWYGAAAAGEEEAGVPIEAALPEPVALPAALQAAEAEEPLDSVPMEAAVADEPLASDAFVHEDRNGAPEAEDGELPAERPFEPSEPAAGLAEASPEEIVTAAVESAPSRLDGNGEAVEAESVETLGGDEIEEAQRQRSRATRHYKIQEVIKRRQIMLVQVTKEERGNKGAALTTYLSLAGRYCVLMPNTGRGGGVSRKITSLGDRRRLKEVLEDLDLPEGMGVIVRTAGSERSKAEIKRDYEYLLRLWNEIRELTLRSTAPALIYEEGNLIKRAIRDLYTRDIDEVLVEGEEGYRTAKAFMKMLMPSHAKRVQPYRDPQVGLLHRFQVEGQIDAIHSPTVQLRSGGYVVINQTEALVAIDVNSGRATRERNIEETALRTNLEAAEEIARQLRLRDLAGLIVIDFIDMEEPRNNGAVERRLKEALKNDRARIQVGRISPFGLLEMSRQRLRPSLVEASTQPCPHCGGTGFIRSTESAALHALRSIEEEGIRRRAAEICVYVPTAIALYILNQKRDSLVQIEARYGLRVTLARDDSLIPPAFRLERVRAAAPGELPTAGFAPLSQVVAEEADEEEEEEAAEAPRSERREAPEEEERSRRRRRRRRRRPEEEPARAARPAVRRAAAEAVPAEEPDDGAPGEPGVEREAGESAGDAGKARRRRGRRGGRRRSRREGDFEGAAEVLRPAADAVEILPAADFAEAPEPEPALAAAGWGSEEDERGIETASLPALAGEGGRAAEPEYAEALPESLPTGEAEEGVPFPEAGEPEHTAAQPAEPEPERVAAYPVTTVGERPEKPRKGWWRRLAP